MLIATQMDISSWTSTRDEILILVFGFQLFYSQDVFVWSTFCLICTQYISVLSINQSILFCYVKTRGQFKIHKEIQFINIVTWDLLPVLGWIFFLGQKCVWNRRAVPRSWVNKRNFIARQANVMFWYALNFPNDFVIASYLKWGAKFWTKATKQYKKNSHNRSDRTMRVRQNNSNSISNDSDWKGNLLKVSQQVAAVRIHNWIKKPLTLASFNGELNLSVWITK